MTGQGSSGNILGRFLSFLAEGRGDDIIHLFQCSVFVTPCKNCDFGGPYPRASWGSWWVKFIYTHSSVKHLTVYRVSQEKRSISQATKLL